jgi:hypothetical protein
MTGSGVIWYWVISRAILALAPFRSDPIMHSTDEQRTACRSKGTRQCAPICLANLSSYGGYDCPEAYHLWTPEAIQVERERRPAGPLAGVKATL